MLAGHYLTVAALQATFEDALLEEALAKKHSLTREAVEVHSHLFCICCLAALLRIQTDRRHQG